MNDGIECANGGRHAVRFLLGREAVALDDVRPTTTVLEWLRTHRRRTGTKEGCAEGDCGACTVLLGSADAAGHVRHEAINACLRLLPTLDGCQLLTVEDLAPEPDELHPVQAALVAAHGSQCGYCTPGFVMSLWTLWRRGEPPSEARILDTLAGNLCRCTGYGPIIDAARHLHATPDPWRARQEAEEAALPDRLRHLQATGSLDYSAGGVRFSAPARLDELAALAAAHPEATLLAGGTDIGLWITKQDRPLRHLIWTGKVPELHAVQVGVDEIRLGAAVTYSAAAGAVAALGEDAALLWRRIGSVPIRNAGTIGGNVANGSPIGDTPPMLMALGARLLLRHGEAARELPIERFFEAYGRQDRRPGEIVVGLAIPRPPPDAIFKVMKITKRFDQDIAAVCGAFLIRLDRQGRVAAARLAFGGLAGIPKRAGAAEAALIGRSWSEDGLAPAIAALAHDFTPLTDQRASAAYRLEVAGNLLRKALIESRGRRLRLDPEPAGPALVAHG